MKINHMKKLALIALLPLAVACNKQANDVVVTPAHNTSGAMAKKTVNTTFTSSAVLGSNDLYQGTFTASGFVSGSGTSSESVNITMPASGNPQALANATYTFHSTQTFTFSSTSSITIVTSGSWAFTSSSLQHATGSGNWTITHGTGDYANLHGTGSLEITDIDFSGTATAVSDEYVGNLHYSSN